MANSGNVIGKVALIQGHVFVQHPDGTRTELHLGDPVREGDRIITSDGAVLELGFSDGHSYVLHQNETLTLDASVFQHQPVDAHDAAISATQLQGLNAVIASGGNLDQLIDPAAAGFSAGNDANSSHSFVQLLRIVESVTPGAFAVGDAQNLAAPEIIPASPHLGAIAAPDVTISTLPTINAEIAGSSRSIAITGTVSSNVPIGETVTLTIDGHNYSGTVLKGDQYSIEVPASVLATASADAITVIVSIPDGLGGSVSATATQSYTVELSAPTISVHINPIPTVNDAEAASAAPIAITGTVSSNVPVGDSVTLTVGGHSYTGTVQSGGSYSIGVPGNVLANATTDTIVASVSSTDAAGNTANASATQNYAPDLLTPATPAVSITGANSAGEVSAATSGANVTLNASGQATLAGGGSVQITVDDNNVVSHLNLSLNGSGQLVDSANTVYSYTNGVISLNEAAPGNANSISVSATVTDVNGNSSATASASAIEYTAVAGAPAVAISGAVNGEINSATAGSGVNATVSLSAAAQNVLSSGGSVQITINDAGSTSALNLHLNGSQLVDASNQTYSYVNGVITLTEAAPGAGGTLTVSATETDVTGAVSGSAAASATEYVPGAPAVVINNVVNGEVNAINGATATVGISAADASLLANGGTITITSNGSASVAMHIVAGVLVDGNNEPVAGFSFSAASNAITVTEPAGTSGTLTVAATVADVFGNSANGSATATQYSASVTAPVVTINNVVNGELNAINGATATVGISAADATILNNGGTITISTNGTASVAMHVVGGVLVDGSNQAVAGFSYNAASNAITVTEPAGASGTLTVAATVADVYGNSANGSASATEYSANVTAPGVTITGASSGSPSYFNDAGGATTTPTVISISAADAAVLANGGFIVISDNGVNSAALHLNTAGVLVNATGTAVGSYSGTNNTITLTENLPGVGNVMNISAVVTDVYGNSASGGNATTIYSAGAETAPVVSISGATAAPNSVFNDGVIPAVATAPVSINVGAADAAILANGGTLTVNSTGSAQQVLTVSGSNVFNGSTLVGSVIAGSGGAETIIINAETVPAVGSNWTVSAQVTDVFHNSVTGSTSTYVYTPLTSAPFVAIPAAVNGELNSATTGSTVNATVTLDPAGVASLQSNGTVQLSIVDAGVTQNLTLHLNGSGALVDGSGATYTYSGGVITLTENAPTTGNSLTVTATSTDAGGMVSASSSASAAEYTPVTAASLAPVVAIPVATANALTNANLDGATNVSATVTLSQAQQNTLASGGTMQVTLVDAGVTQNLNLSYNGSSLVDSLGHTYSYVAGVVTLTQAAPGTGNALTVTAVLTDVAGHSTPAGTSSATETITLPDTPTVALLANGLTGNYYGVTESQISSPPTGYTALEEVDAYLLNRAVATSTVTPTGFPGAITAPVNASFIATEINYGLNTTSTSPAIANEIIGNNLGTYGNLAKWLDVTGTSGPYATNFLSTIPVNTSTSQAIVTMTGVVALPTLGSGQEYALKIFADDGYQVYIDGVQVATVPANQSGKADYFYFTAPATAGNLHTIQILYWDQGGATSIQASLGTILTANVPANSTITPTLVTPLSILTPAMVGEVTATVSIDSNNQTILNHGGTVLITESNGTNLVLHQNSSNQIVDASGLRYTYINGVIYIPVATSSSTASITATVVDQYSYASGTASTGPAITIASNTNHDGYLNSSEVAGEATSGHILANVSLNTSMLTGTGSATITVVDNGITTTLGVSSSGTITGTTANVTATYSAGVLAISLINPGNGNSATISASQTDGYGHVSATTTSTIVENINAAPAAPTVAITSDTNHDGFLSAPELGGSSTVNATVTLNSAAQTTLSNGGTVQINVTDNGTTETLNLHLNSSGTLVNAAGASSAEYSYAAGVITLTENAPGNGHSIAISASTTDIAGNASAVSATASAIQDVLDSPVVMTLGAQHATVTLDAANQTVLAATGSTLTVSASDGTSLTLHENSSGQLVDATNAVHSFTNGIVPLTLNNSASAQVVTVSATLTDNHGVNSSTSSATLVNSGSNQLTELAGGDTFVFALSANGTPGTAHTETISAFNSNAAANGGDVLNLADLLTGVSPSATAATLSNYLHFSEVGNGSGGYTTTVHVSSGGGFSGGFSAGQETLQIVLTNADLTHSAGVSLSDTQIIQSLLNQHKLVD